MLRLLCSSLVLVGCGAILSAQTAANCSGAYAFSSETITCPQGTTISLDFGQGFAEIAAELNGASDGITFTYNLSASENLPPGVTFSPSGLLSGTLTTAGTFSFTVNITYDFQYMGTDYPFSFPAPQTFIVTPYAGASTVVDPSGLGFHLTQGAPAVTQSVNIANQSNTAEAFTASASTASGGNWLSLSPSSGSIASFGASSIGVTADPSSLPPGTYTGTVAISITGGKSYAVSVLATVTGNQPNIQLSQSGLRFLAVTGGAATPPQIITVLNSGAGTLNFSASPSTVTGGNWLSVTQQSSSVTVSVNPAGLAAGDYYGQIKFTAQGAANSPQVASVVLNVLSPADSPGASVQPSGLIFVGTAGGANPAAKSLSITNPSPTALTYLGTAFSNSGTNNGTNWITFSPSSGSVSATQPATVSVQPNLKGLAAGIYLGQLALNIVPPATSGTTTPPASQTFQIEVLLIVLPPGGSAANAVQPRASCAPTKLLPVFTQLATGFTTTAAWPTAIEVTVVDDCGTPLTAGSVITTFSSGDPALSLNSLKDGRWAATWQPVHTVPQVTVSAKAQEIQPALQGAQMVGGALQANPVAPVVPAGGVVSAASFVANQPLAPGAFAAIFGSNLSLGTAAALQLPLNTKLNTTSVTLNGEQLPLLYSSGQQINAVIPYDIPVDSTQQLLVQMGSAISVPQTVVIATAQPALFTPDGSGKGPAIFTGFNPDGSQLPAGAAVGANGVITIYGSGLGAVMPAVPAGSAAPSAPPAVTVNTVTATLGGVPAKVLFAGLAPGFAQLYQMNILIPSGVTPGNAVLLLTVSGQQSAPVTILVK